MIERCHKEKLKDKYPTYYGICRVSDEWLNFQNFAEWYENNYYGIPNESCQLDKDIIKRGNQVYCPEYCMFVPQSINLLFARKKRFRGELPCGVTKKKNGYMVQIGYNHIVENLGIYPTIETAFMAYKQRKEEMVKESAEKYKYILPERVYEALYKWEAYIDD